MIIQMESREEIEKVIDEIYEIDEEINARELDIVLLRNKRKQLNEKLSKMV
jgi:hypothetical protein